MLDPRACASNTQGGGVSSQIKHFPPGACDLEEEIAVPLTCDLEEESRNWEDEITSDLEEEIGGRIHSGPGGRNYAQFGLRTWRTKMGGRNWEEGITSDLGRNRLGPQSPFRASDLEEEIYQNSGLRTSGRLQPAGRN